MARLPWDLQGQVVVISGGNAGIGLGFARGIAKAGGDLVIWGRRQDKNEVAADELRGLGAKVLTQEVDVSDENRVIEAFAQAVSTMGRVDGAIANAGLMMNQGCFTNMTGEAWHSLLSVNQHGAFYLAREAARHMRGRAEAGDAGGSILFCASLSAVTGSIGMQHYNASKGAMASLARESPSILANMAFAPTPSALATPRARRSRIRAPIPRSARKCVSAARSRGSARPRISKG